MNFTLNSTPNWELTNMNGEIRRRIPSSAQKPPTWDFPSTYIKSLDPSIQPEMGRHITSIAKATAKVIHDTAAVANAILIAPDKILSLAHCFPNGSGCVVFDSVGPIVVKPYLRSTVLSEEKPCDFAILSLETPVSIEPAKLSLTDNPEKSVFFTHHNGQVHVREYDVHQSGGYMPRFHQYNFKTMPSFSGGPSMEIENGKVHCLHQGESSGLRIVDIYAELDRLARTHMDIQIQHKAKTVMNEMSIHPVERMVWRTNTTTFPIYTDEVPPEIGSNMVAKGAVLNPSEFGFYPMGFKDFDMFKEFIKILLIKLIGTAKEAFKNQDFAIVFHGSSVTGESFKDKKTVSRDFDSGRVSDYDITLVSYSLFQQAKQCGAKVRGHDQHTEPLTTGLVSSLGLSMSQTDSEQYIHRTQGKKRDVNFMVYESLKDATKHEGGALKCAIYDRQLFTEPLGDLGGIHK